VITGAQIRAARALLRWSALKLAGKCGVSEGTIQNAEKTDDVPARMLYDSLLKIKTALEKGGVEFTNDDQPGVRMKRKGRK
jgi:transcriptional regulator with XRE-family HTH domain